VLPRNQLRVRKVNRGGWEGVNEGLGKGGGIAE